MIVIVTMGGVDDAGAVGTTSRSLSGSRRWTSVRSRWCVACGCRTRTTRPSPIAHEKRRSGSDRAGSCSGGDPTETPTNLRRNQTTRVPFRIDTYRQARRPVREDRPREWSGRLVGIRGRVPSGAPRRVRGLPAGCGRGSPRPGRDSTGGSAIAVASRTGWLHWHHEDHQRRARTAQAVAGLPADHLVVIGTRCVLAKQERARRQVLQRLL